jgi:hypothetical protein
MMILPFIPAVLTLVNAAVFFSPHVADSRATLDWVGRVYQDRATRRTEFIPLKTNSSRRTNGMNSVLHGLSEHGWFLCPTAAVEHGACAGAFRMLRGADRLFAPANDGLGNAGPAV